MVVRSVGRDATNPSGVTRLSSFKRQYLGCYEFPLLVKNCLLKMEMVPLVRGREEKGMYQRVIRPVLIQNSG